MTKDEIIDKQFLERYVTGRLSPDELEQFEIALLENPEYLDDLDAISHMQGGIRRYAAQQSARGREAIREPVNLLTRVHGWLNEWIRQPVSAFAVVALVALPLILLRSGGSSPQPGINTAFLALGSNSRSAGTVPSVFLSPDSETLVVSVILPYGTPLFDYYIFALYDENESFVWESGKLLQDHRDRLLLDFPRQYLAPREYAYRVYGVMRESTPDKTQVTVLDGRFSVREERTSNDA